VPMISTLLVQEDNEPPFRISCTIESRYSRCIPLPKGESFDARKEKHGMTVYYVDEKGKERRQLYALVDAGGKAVPAAAAAQPVPAAAQPAPAAAAPRQRSFSSSSSSSSSSAAVQSVPAQPAAAPAAPAPAVAPSVGAVQATLLEKVEKVKCKFSSTPAGADITLDGKYVGSTPSEITVTTGEHVVLFSMAGFTQWKRELTVLPGSELNVSAILQKEQP
jgi:hypothetical protein